ncbi:hypothetical protein OPV22_004392 [Ensete ventricosum]|uniref:rRNA biogenesis protein RRP36 n=1 Tax=Ensete ventricosum TaxID=4639 RepID=A0AAV8S3F9_ENSVE|nr:hypothetical protein OPV22_004392 [Ensete ventricosum]
MQPPPPLLYRSTTPPGDLAPARTHLQRARADGSRCSHASKLRQQLKPSRANKNRPIKTSSKMRVRRFREVVQAPKKVVIDPRFESLCGTLDTDGFRKRYSFLFEVELPAEEERLQKLIRKSKDPNAVEELKSDLCWIDKQIKSGPRKSAESEILSEHIKKERKAAKRGKRPGNSRKKPDTKSTLNSRLQESLILTLRRGRRKMLPRTIVTYRTADLAMMHSSFAQSECALFISIPYCRSSDDARE